MKTKTVKTYDLVAAVYFPPESLHRERQSWLRKRGFRALESDASFCRRSQLDWTRLLSVAKCYVLTSKQEMPQRFAGEYLAVATKVSGDTLLAAYDLLWETFVANSFHRSNGHGDKFVARPELRLKDTRRGRAHWGGGRARWFSVPKWAMNISEEYAIYYAAHELAHHAFFGIGHGPAMCAVEDALLTPFDLEIVYNGGRGKDTPFYPKQLLRKSTKTILHNRPTKAKA